MTDARTRPRIDELWIRVLAVAGAVGLSVPAAVVCFAFGLLAAEDCFIECVDPDPNPVGAAAFYVASVLLLAVGPVVAWSSPAVVGGHW